jgi:hypothetical protein
LSYGLAKFDAAIYGIEQIKRLIANLVSALTLCGFLTDPRSSHSLPGPILTEKRSGKVRCCDDELAYDRGGLVAEALEESSAAVMAILQANFVNMQLPTEVLEDLEMG